MIYEFDYYKTGQKQKTKIIYANNDREAVLKLYDEVGICEFGCIKPNGEMFTDRKYAYEKKLIMKGC